MGRDVAVARNKRLQRQAQALERTRGFRSRAAKHSIDHHRSTLPWRSRNLGVIIVGSLFGSLLLIIGMVGVVTMNSIESAQNSETVNELVTSVQELIEREREQKERERAERARLSEEQKSLRDKGALIFWIILAGFLMIFSFQFAGLWGVGIAMMTIILIVGVVMGYIVL